MSQNEHQQSVEYAELQTVLFLSGTNLGQKLDPTKRSGLGLVFDNEKKRLIVSYSGKIAQVPEPNVAYWIEGKPQVEEKTAMKKVQFSAQVSTPQDHVFAGPGGGKARDAK